MTLISAPGLIALQSDEEIDYFVTLLVCRQVQPQMDSQSCASPVVISSIGIAWSPRVDIIFLEIRQM